MTGIEQAAMQVAVALVVAVVTASLTVWLSLRRFYREKWWEAKLGAYTRIIDSLHHAKRDAEVKYEAELMQRKVDSDFHKELSRRHSEAWSEILRNIDVGEFLISRNALAVLETYKGKVTSASDDPNSSYFEVLDTELAALADCLPAFKKAAREDLGLRG